MKNLLFLCCQNVDRSPTAEQLVKAYARFNVRSAGLCFGALTLATPRLIKWSDAIFVMESAHEQMLDKQFGLYLKDKSVICLNIAEKYRFMDPILVDILRHKIAPYLGAI